MEDKVKLTITIENRKPVELTDLAQSMMGLGAEYQGYLSRHHAHIDADGARLYVKEVRSGSVITELVALAPYALPLIEHADSILEYGKYIGGLLDWYIGRGSKPAEKPEKATLQNLVEIIEPVAKDNGAQFNISGFTVNGDVTVNFHMNSTEANAAQNMIRRDLLSLKEPLTGEHQQVVMYWVQARNQASSKSGDRGRIESLYSGDVKVMFVSDAIKSTMLQEAHPFNKAYVVDVMVETVGGKPVLYKVTHLHDILDAATPIA